MGHRFSGAMVSNIGHGNPRVVAAMRAQLERAAFGYRLHFENEPAMRLVRRHFAALPGRRLNAIGREAVLSAVEAFSSSSVVAVRDPGERRGD